MMLKRLKVYFLSFSIAVSPIFIIQNANASTLAGGSGWRVASTVANGIGVTVNGAKDVLINGAKKTVTGVANVTPTAGQVGKFMGKNLAGAAVVGVMDLLLDGADYVLDPANNTVTYNKGENDILGTGIHVQGVYGSSASQACKNYINKLQTANKTYKYQYSSVTNVVLNSGTLYQFTCKYLFDSYPTDSDTTMYPGSATGFIQNPQNVEQQKITIPLVNLGSQVIEQAQEEVRTGNPAVPIATPVTQAAATAVVGEAATDETQARPITAELDKSAAIPTDETAVGEIAPPTTNPDTGEVKPGSISLDFPVFCSWAPSMCVLADKVQEAIVDARDYLKEEPISEASTEVEFEEPKEPEPQKEYFRWGGQCPFSKDSETIKLNDESTEVDYDLTSWCDMATEVKPFVLGAGAIASLMIVSGTGMGRGED